MLFDMTVVATILVASVGVKRVNQLCMMLSRAYTPGRQNDGEQLEDKVIGSGSSRHDRSKFRGPGALTHFGGTCD